MGRVRCLTSVGLYYQVTDKKEPEVTVVRCFDNFHVCQRERMRPNLKKIVADTQDSYLARMIAGEIQRILDSTHIQTDVAMKPPLKSLL